MEFDIVVLGSTTRDVFLTTDAKVVEDASFVTGQGLCLELGAKVEVKKIAFTSGGGGHNASVTFARQGFKTACVGVVGDDANGRDVLAELSKEGIDHSLYQVHQDDFTAYSTVLVHSSGERTILSYKGEGQHFDASKLNFDQLKSKWMYLDSLGGNFDVLEKSVTWAVANGVKLATNPGGKELEHGLDKLKPLLKNFSVVIMNQEEAAKLTGIDYKDEKKIFASMDELITGVFVMTKGPQGVAVSDGQNVYRAGVPDSPVVERTGAGDAFSAGFVSEYMRSGDVAGAIQFGTSNASSVVTQYGAKAGILKKDEKSQWPPIEVLKE